MKVISEDIRSKQFHRIYLLFGEERYLVNQYRDKLIRALVAEGDNMNFTSFSGNGVSTQEVIDLAETLPFFAEQRVILWENSELFLSDNEEFADYLTQAPKSTCFIFVETKIDKRNKMFKTVAKEGYPAQMQEQDEESLKRWIVGMIREENKNITVAALTLFLDKTGDDMYLIRSELEKLLCYCSDVDAITPKEVEDVCSTKLNGKVFAMIDAVGNKKQEEALGLYYDLLALKEPPIKTLVLIGRQFAHLLTVKDLRERGFDKRRIAEKMGIKDYFAGRYMEQANKFDITTLKTALSDCVQADEDIKMGRMNDQLCVETILVKYSNP